MKTIFFFITLSITSIGCNSQNKSDKKNQKTETTEQTKGKNPKENVKVNKQYDSKGNLIKYDSTYSYFHTSKGVDSSKIALDSIFRDFKLEYSTNFSKLVDQEFKDLFLSDTLFKYDFLNNDYFKKRFEMNLKKFEELFSEMDMHKSEFLNKINTEQPKNNKKKRLGKS